METTVLGWRCWVGGFVGEVMMRPKRGRAMMPVTVKMRMRWGFPQAGGGKDYVTSMGSMTRAGVSWSHTDTKDIFILACTCTIATMTNVDRLTHWGEAWPNTAYESH